jgi:hypothetical protein
MMWVRGTCRWIIEVVVRLQQTQGFVGLKKRRVVERTGNVLDLCLVSLAIMEDATYRESAHRSSAL